MVNKIKAEDKRAEFELAYKRFASCMEQILPNHVPTENINLGGFHISGCCKARFEPEKDLDISDCGQGQKIISDHLESEELSSGLSLSPYLIRILQAN